MAAHISDHRLAALIHMYMLNVVASGGHYDRPGIGFLTKPFEGPTLIKHLDTVLKRHRGAHCK